MILYARDGTILSKETIREKNIPENMTSNYDLYTKAAKYTASLEKMGIFPRKKRSFKSTLTLEFPVEEAYMEGVAEEIGQYEAVMSQKTAGGSFFAPDMPVLVDSSGNWDQDVQEARRRMDDYFSTSLFFERYREQGKNYRGSWWNSEAYECTFSSVSYYSSHDGDWDSMETTGWIRRISPMEFFYPSDAWRAKERIDNGIHFVNGTLQYKVREHIRVKNFLGMVGYFDIGTG